MRTPYNEQADLDLVAEHFMGKGLAAERFPSAEMQSGKTPDFRIRHNGLLVAYCEVKAPNDPWLDDLLEDAPDLTLVGGLRNDPIPNRLARLLTKADAQFAAVNVDRTALNILAYVNHYEASHYQDLVETVTGYFHADDGTKHATLLHIAEGRIGQAKRRIDAFLWFEAKTGHMAGAIVNQDDRARMHRLCGLLGFDAEKIS